MRTPTTIEWVRLPVDDWVDRPDVEAPQGVQLTGTNRPRAWLTLLTSFKALRVHYAVLGIRADARITP